MPEQTLKWLIEEFLSCIHVTNEKSTVEYYGRYCRRFLRDIGDLPLSELKAKHLIAWGETWHHVQAIKRLFAWGVNEGEVITRNPFVKVRKPAAGRRKRVLKRKTMLLMMRRSDRYFRRFLLAMRETLGRPQEIRALCWEFLRAEDGREDVISALVEGRACFVLEEYKSRKRRLDPEAPRILLVSKRLARLLLRMVRGKVEVSGYVFLNTKRKPWTNNAVRCRMRQLRRKLDLTKDHRGENIVAYTIRHTQATNAAIKGVRDKVLADLMGHTSTRTTERYQHLEVAHLRDAIDGLGERKKAA